MAGVFFDIIRMFYSPSKVFRRAREKSAAGPAAVLFVLSAAFAVLFYIYHVKGKETFYPVFTVFPEENYYFYQSLFYFPLSVIVLFTASFFIRKISGSMGGAGDFSGLTKSLVYSIYAPWYLHFLFDAAFVSAFVHHFALGGSVLLSYIYTVIAVKESEKFGTRKSLIAATAGLAAAGLINFIFVR